LKIHRRNLTLQILRMLLMPLFQTLFNDNSVSKFFNSAPNTSMPLQSFSTLQSTTPTLPSMPTHTCGNTSQPDTTNDPKDQRRPKRSKLEKDIGKIRKDFPRLFEGQRAILSYQVYNNIENQIQRDWKTNVLSMRYNVPPPIAHPFPPLVAHPFPPPLFTMLVSAASSSYDDSSPTP